MATTKATTLAHGQAGLIASGTLADARIPNLATSKITSGTFADARIAQSNVTQHEGSIDALASNPTVTLGSNTTFPGPPSAGTFNGGHIIQVKYFEHDDSVTVNNPSSAVAGPWETILSGAITMANQSNKILITGVGSAGGSSITYEFTWRLVRTVGGSDQPVGGNRDPDSKFLGDYIFMSGSASGENAMTLSNTYLDTPNTENEITYKLQCMSGETATVYANRGYSTNDGKTWANSGNTTLTLMEIQG